MLGIHCICVCVCVCVILVTKICFSWLLCCYSFPGSKYFLHRDSLSCHQHETSTSTFSSIIIASISPALFLLIHHLPCLSFIRIIFFMLSTFGKQNQLWSMGRCELVTYAYGSEHHLIWQAKWLRMKVFILKQDVPLFTLWWLVHLHLYSLWRLPWIDWRSKLARICCQSCVNPFRHLSSNHCYSPMFGGIFI